MYNNVKQHWLHLKRQFYFAVTTTWHIYCLSSFCLQTTASHMEILPQGILGYDVILLVWRTGDMMVIRHQNYISP